MTDKVKSVVNLYGELLESHLDRVEKATTLVRSRQYDATDLARDWGELAVDMVDAWTKPWATLFPKSDSRILRVNEGKNRKSHQYRVDDPGPTGMDFDTHFIRLGSASIPFTGTLSADRKTLTIAIAVGSGLELATPGAMYLANVYVGGHAPGALPILKIKLDIV